jgi:hypothetical protein
MKWSRRKTDDHMKWNQKGKSPDTIAGERRADKRYELQLDLRWKLIRRRRVLEAGSGRTIDVSSGGINFDAGRELPPGFNVELALSWPIMLHSVAPLQLVVQGRILRCEGNRVAIRMAQHEFRTTGHTEGRLRTSFNLMRSLVNGPGTAEYN